MEEEAKQSKIHDKGRATLRVKLESALHVCERGHRGGANVAGYIEGS